jgi:hypothetical protein
MYGYMQKMNEVIYCSPHPVSVIQQAIAAATDKAILGVGLPEMRNGIAAFLDKQKPAWP